MPATAAQRILDLETIDLATRIADSVGIQWLTWTVAGGASLEAHSKTLLGACSEWKWHAEKTPVPSFRALDKGLQRGHSGGSVVVPLGVEILGPQGNMSGQVDRNSRTLGPGVYIVVVEKDTRTVLERGEQDMPPLEEFGRDRSMGYSLGELSVMAVV